VLSLRVLCRVVFAERFLPISRYKHLRELTPFGLDSRLSNGRMHDFDAGAPRSTLRRVEKIFLIVFRLVNCLRTAKLQWERVGGAAPVLRAYEP
jgi:hypothetical protein